MVEQLTNTLSSYQDSWRDLRAIRNEDQKDFINSLDFKSFLWEDKSEEFLNNFTEWVKGSKLNDFSKLDSFPHRVITCGSIQAFDHWYIRYGGKPITYGGEFMYHNGANKYSEEAKSVIVSMPFTANGQVIENYDSIINSDIPVMLDFCHAPTSKGLVLDDNDSIKEICFSVSKAFWGGEWLRVGVRYSKINHDDGIDIANEVKMVPRLGIGVANSLIDKYDFDYPWNTYGHLYEKVCKRLNLSQTNNVMFGIGGEEYEEYNRAGYNRICLSEEINKEYYGEHYE